MVISCGWYRKPEMRVGRQHALGVAEQLGAAAWSGVATDLLVKRVERLVVVAEIVIRLGELDEVERLDMR